jgi:hypothetical protein
MLKDLVYEQTSQKYREEVKKLTLLLTLAPIYFNVFYENNIMNLK